jgi:uncharacterized protein YjbI with pentapeptide repeats
MATAFEPDKYLTSLITAVNDGAKSAQTGAIAFTLVGLYLLATAFSTTDENLLLQHNIPVSQIGVQVPVVFSFGIAPAVFLFLHVYTLIRYDMLAVNLRQFHSELASVPVQSDANRYRQLLTNVEFVQVRTGPHSPLYYIVEWLVLAGFPVATLLIVQVSSLRYQSDIVIWTQRICITLDLVLLFWFYPRQGWRPPRNPSSRVPYWVPWTLLVLVLIADWWYLNAPSAGEQTVRRGDLGPSLREAYRQPLDLLLCPAWGCRYLSVDHRTLVGHVWSQQAIANLRANQPDAKKSLASIEGIYLRDRTLRFAEFDESRLYAADMRAADLSGATFQYVSLQGANLEGACLVGAGMYRADLRGANMEGAMLAAADLTEADLRGVNLEGATLRGTDLTDADLRGASLVGADLREAKLKGADLGDANLGPPRPRAPGAANVSPPEWFGRCPPGSSAPNLRGAAVVTQDQLKEACGNSNTKLPSELRELKVPICPPRSQ